MPLHYSYVMYGPHSARVRTLPACNVRPGPLCSGTRGSGRIIRPERPQRPPVGRSQGYPVVPYRVPRASRGGPLRRLYGDSPKWGGQRPRSGQRWRPGPDFGGTRGSGRIIRPERPQRPPERRLQGYPVVPYRVPRASLRGPLRPLYGDSPKWGGQDQRQRRNPDFPGTLESAPNHQPERPQRPPERVLQGTLWYPTGYHARRVEGL